jgi:hypothetical protein
MVYISNFGQLRHIYCFLFLHVITIFFNVLCQAMNKSTYSHTVEDVSYVMQPFLYSCLVESLSNCCPCNECILVVQQLMCGLAIIMLGINVFSMHTWVNSAYSLHNVSKYLIVFLCNHRSHDVQVYCTFTSSI